MLGAAPRPRAQPSIMAGPSQTNPIAAENTTVDSAPVKLETAMATPAPEGKRENEATTANQPFATEESRYRHSDPSPLGPA